MSADGSITVQLPAVHVTAAPPTTVTQHTCLAVLGIAPRAYLREIVPAYRSDGGKVGTRGKLRICDRAALAGWLLEGERTSSRTTESDPTDVLAESLGLRVSGKRP